MRLTVRRGKTLLIDGPASVTLLSGSVRVWGAVIKPPFKIVVRNGRRLPFEAPSDSEFELMLGETSSFLEMEGSSIPKSWTDCANLLLASKEHLWVIVLGAVDTGKTSLCTYLANQALGEGRKVAIMDGDLGQSDIGPPSTVGSARIIAPIVELYGIQAQSLAFVGTTTPSKDVSASLNALKTLRSKISEIDADLVIVNTDGWVQGEEAIDHKRQLAELFEPCRIVVIREADELGPLLEKLGSADAITVESSKAAKKRGHDTRKSLRELVFRKYLKNGKVRSYPLNLVRGAARIVEPVRANERSPSVHYEPTSTKRDENQKGVIVGLEGDKGDFLGIGIICSIDHDRRTVKVYTPVNQDVRAINVGQIRLDSDGREIS